MRTIFLSHEIEKEVTLSNAQKQLNEHRKKDAGVLSSIQQAVADTFFFSRIINATKTNKAWDTLRKPYRGTMKVGTVKDQSLRINFKT